MISARTLNFGFRSDTATPPPPNTPLSRRGRGEKLTTREGLIAAPVGCSGWFSGASSRPDKSSQQNPFNGGGELPVFKHPKKGYDRLVFGELSDDRHGLTRTATPRQRRRIATRVDSAIQWMIPRSSWRISDSAHLGLRPPQLSKHLDPNRRSGQEFPTRVGASHPVRQLQHAVRSLVQPATAASQPPMRRGPGGICCWSLYEIGRHPADRDPGRRNLGRIDIPEIGWGACRHNTPAGRRTQRAAPTPRSAARAAGESVCTREGHIAAPVGCGEWILMKALACEDGGGVPSPPFAPSPNRRPFMRASNRPPMSDSTPAWTCTPDPSSSASSTATDRHDSAATSPPPPNPSSTPSQPFRDEIVVGGECMHCWYWLADCCRETRTPLRPRTRPGHESRAWKQDQVRPTRRQGHRPAPARRQLPAGLRLSQKEKRTP